MTNLFAGILLAAGKSTRFGDHKLSQLLPDTRLPVALQAANNLLEVLPLSVAVIRESDSQLKHLLSSSEIAICENGNADLGISSSIKTGIQFLDKLINAETNIRGYVIALADMPFIDPAVFQKVITGLSEDCLICAPQYRGRRGHPVGFSSELKHELLKLQGDNGAKAVIDRYQTQLQLFDTQTNGILTDIDYPTDLVSRSGSLPPNK